MLKLLLTFTDACNYFKKLGLLTGINLPSTVLQEVWYLQFTVSKHVWGSWKRSQLRIQGRRWWQKSNQWDAYRSKMDNSLGGHRASHEANELQLGAVLCNGSHGSICDLDNRTEKKNSSDFFSVTITIDSLVVEYIWLVHIYKKTYHIHGERKSNSKLI